MVSAAGPPCKILLVEADSNSFANLAAAVDTAAQQADVVAIRNSYGGGEYSGEVNDQQHYNHPGIAVTISSGDNGYGAEFPAASQYVIAVGGTSLTKSGFCTRRLAMRWLVLRWKRACFPANLRSLRFADKDCRRFLHGP